MDQEGLVTSEIQERCHRNYFTRMDPSQPLYACGACGISDVPIDQNSPSVPDYDLDVISFTEVEVSDANRLLRPLYYTAQQTQKYNSPFAVDGLLRHIPDTAENRARWERYRPIISMYVLQPTDAAAAPMYLHVYSEGVSLPSRSADGEYHHPTMHLCQPCHRALTRCLDLPEDAPQEEYTAFAPVPSIAAGYDMGSTARVQNPPMATPSFCEGLCLPRGRVLSTALHIDVSRRCRSGTYRCFQGHCIVFPDFAAEVCGMEMPNAAYAGQEVSLLAI
jgi:hypothetical protein